MISYKVNNFDSPVQIREYNFDKKIVMKKCYLLFTFLLSCVIYSKAQSWKTVGTGTSQSIRAIASFGQDLWAGGTFSSAGSVSASRAATWNGISWSAIGTGMNDQVLVMENINGELYVGGGFTSVNGISANSIAVWDGLSWTAMGSGMNDVVKAIAEYKNDIYAGGTFTTAGGVSAKGIAKWDGTQWNPVNIPVNGNVIALKVFNNELYVGGDFTTVGTTTVNYILKWDGTNWSSIGTGMNGWVMCFEIFNNELYAGGRFTTAGGATADRVAKLNGAVGWTGVGSGLNVTSSGLFDGVYTMKVHNNKLYAGGAFSSTSKGFHDIVSWNGTTWSDAAQGMSSSLGYGVQSLTIHQSELYAGGQFSSPSGYVAVLGTATQTVNSQEEKSMLKIYPNPAQNSVAIIIDGGEAKNISMEITDMLGRSVDMVCNSTMIPSGGFNVIKDLSDEKYPAGIYFVNVRIDEKLITEKLIVE